jgi:Raf kinase inhibitor-like YbhB/YbcL family protein
MLITMLATGPARAAPAALTVVVEGLQDGRLPPRAAFCVPPSWTGGEHDVSPAVSWSPGPPGTKSYALIMTDLDVPKDLAAINAPGVVIPKDAPRITFIHWVLVDIPPAVTRLEAGVESSGIARDQHALGATDHGLRGANVYSGFYPKGSPLAGVRGGYDGPCPPNNDLKAHRYVTRVYALDVPTLGLTGTFFGEAALSGMEGHVLASGDATALYGPPQTPKTPQAPKPPTPPER